MAEDISRSNRDRGGVSLLEVLISIGVLSVGMLGAATMLPLAKYYATEASKFDRASTLGQQAYHDLQIRGYLSIKKWLKPDIAGLNYNNASAMLVDPLAWSYASANGTPIPNFFPAFPNNGTNPPLSSGPIVFRTNIDINRFSMYQVVATAVRRLLQARWLQTSRAISRGLSPSHTCPPT
jgi:type II secretory pathway pseudopilin PulG